MLSFALRVVIGCFDGREDSDWLIALRGSPPLCVARFFFCLWFGLSLWSRSRSDRDPVSSGERSLRISLTSGSLIRGIGVSVRRLLISWRWGLVRMVDQAFY